MSDNICRICSKREPTLLFLCWECAREKMHQEDLERDERISSYGDPMNWDQWVDWLGYYGLPVGSHFVFSLKMYIKYGCELPFEAQLADHPHLETEIIYYQIDNVPEHTQIAVSAATIDRVLAY